MQHKSEDLLHSIYRTAEINLERNEPDCPCEAIDMAQQYLDKFRSVITRDIINTERRRLVHDDLIDALNECVYLSEVFREYIDIIELIENIEAEELANEITNPETTTSNSANNKK